MNMDPGRMRARNSKGMPSSPNGVASVDWHAGIVRMAEVEAANRAALRRAMVTRAAYLRAERRGFEPGHELEDWLAAELEVANAQQLTILSPGEDAGYRRPC